MTCGAVRERIDAWLLGHLPPAEVEAIDAHVEVCPTCRALTADLRMLQHDVRLIGAEGPPPHVWARIADRLQERPVERGIGAAIAVTPSHAAAPISWRGLAVAASLALVVGVSLFLLRQSLFRDGREVPTTVAAPMRAPSLVETIEFELDQAAEHYERAIAGLEQVASAGDSPLDPALTATLRENLGIIDAAIAESRDALRAEPTSELAQQSLFDAFRRKVALLQDTIALMNEMRKGNQAGATAIASGLNKG